jgi:hypothetical protein
MCGNNKAKCEWKPVDEKNPTTPPTDPTKPTDPSDKPTVPTGPTPLFSKEFCHPVKISDVEATAQDEFAQCFNNPKDNCNVNCKWSDGTELIPKNDFCAPADLTDDFKQIVKCVNALGETTCAPPCKWRRGKQPAANVPTEPATND